MRLRLAAAAAFLVLAVSVLAEVKPADTVAIIGDSITEQKMYSVFIEDYLLMCQPAMPGQVIQFGWGGETAEGFKNRMDNDCFRYHPTVATTCYGMNDGKYGPQTPQNAKWYHENQRAVVEGMKKAGVRFIVIGSPGCVDLNTFRGNRQQAEVYNRTLADERDIAKRVAEEEGVTFADVFDPMVDVMTKAEQKFGAKYHVAGGDGVHPAANGHLVMAYAFLKALGLDGDIGTITVDMGSGKAEATEGHKVISASGGEVVVESRRYPFCFYGDTTSDPNSTRPILQFLPFNQDLNRFTLIVKGATGPMKVTWGERSKQFDAEQLGKGINLAAEFLDNPFNIAFASVHKEVQAQQNYETPLIKMWVHGLPQFQSEFPGEAQSYERVIGAMGGKDQGLYKTASAAVKPVKHTIKIEPGK
jgi:lysophospholipase L1-like esterase